MYKSVLLTAWIMAVSVMGFTPKAPPTTTTAATNHHRRVVDSTTPITPTSTTALSSTARRDLLQGLATATMAASIAAVGTWSPAAANAADTAVDLDGYLYKIVRVREATQQERRLIQSGKFKDKARQNVKLAVKFMIQNYQLSDSIVGASAYLVQGNQMKAIDAGQSAVQNLQTILEYFDSSDIENIKVNSLAGKEVLVLKGLEAAQYKIDDFLAYFPELTVAAVRKRIKEENDLNVKEFDPALGDILNLPPPS